MVGHPYHTLVLPPQHSYTSHTFPGYPSSLVTFRFYKFAPHQITSPVFLWGLLGANPILYCMTYLYVMFRIVMNNCCDKKTHELGRNKDPDLFHLSQRRHVCLPGSTHRYQQCRMGRTAPVPFPDPHVHVLCMLLTSPVPPPKRKAASRCCTQPPHPCGSER